MGVKIQISTPVYPTEDAEKIKNAILLLFPDTTFTQKGSILHGESNSIEEFGRILREMHIRDAARAIFLRNMHDNCVEFKLNKQVATVGKISFSVGDAPLGDLTVKICSPDIQNLIDQIAPDTRIQR